MRGDLHGEPLEAGTVDELLGGREPDAAHERLLRGVLVHPRREALPVARLEEVGEVPRRRLALRVRFGRLVVGRGGVPIELAVPRRLTRLQPLAQRPRQLAGEAAHVVAPPGDGVEERRLEVRQVELRLPAQFGERGARERGELGQRQHREHGQEAAEAVVAGGFEEVRQLRHRLPGIGRAALGVRIADLGEQRQRPQLLERAPRPLDDLLVLRRGRVGEPSAHEAARFASRRRGQADRALEGAEPLEGAQGQVGHRDQERGAVELGERLDERGPQPLRRRDPRDVRGVQPQGREAEAVLAPERLRDVQEEHLASLVRAGGVDDRPRDVGLRVRLHGEGAGGADADELRLQRLARGAEAGAEAREGGREVGAGELEPDEPIRGRRRELERLLDVVAQERLAAAWLADDHEPRVTAGAHALDERAVRAALLPTEQLQHFLVVAATGCEQHLELGRPQRPVPAVAPQLVEGLEEHALVRELPLVAVDDVAHHVRVGAAHLHLVPEPVDAPEHAVLVAFVSDALAHVFEDAAPGARGVAGGCSCSRHPGSLRLAPQVRTQAS